MPVIQDTQGTGTRYPVVKRTEIGQTFRGAYVKHDQRDRLKDGNPVINAKGKPSQELVVYVVTMPGTTSPAGLGEDVATPAPGDIVRLIISGLTFSQWIEQQNALKGVQRAGDIIEFTTTSAQAYNSDGSPKGPKITDQAKVVEARMKGTTVGVYGDLIVRACTTSELPWVHKADDALLAVTNGPTINDHDDEAF